VANEVTAPAARSRPKRRRTAPEDPLKAYFAGWEPGEPEKGDHARLALDAAAAAVDVLRDAWHGARSWSATTCSISPERSGMATAGMCGLSAMFAVWLRIPVILNGCSS
jgi:hypothetical protein